MDCCVTYLVFNRLLVFLLELAANTGGQSVSECVVRGHFYDLKFGSNWVPLDVLNGDSLLDDFTSAQPTIITTMGYGELD